MNTTTIPVTNTEALALVRERIASRKIDPADWISVTNGVVLAANSPEQAKRVLGELIDDDDLPDKTKRHLQALVDEDEFEKCTELMRLFRC